MKMTKKFLMCAAVAAVLFGIVSCKPEIGDIEWKDKGNADGTQTFLVEKQKNDASGTIRGMKQVGVLDRAQSTCVVQQFDQTNTSCDGMVGFATYFKENKKPGAANDGTINFLVVGVRNNKKEIETYASYFCNINKDALSTTNFGTDKVLSAYDKDVTYPYEVIILDLPSDKNRKGVLKSQYFTDSVNTVKIAIDFSMDNDGNITIGWYDNYKASAGSTAAASISFDGITPLLTVKATKEQLGTTSKSNAGKIYAYANIYTGKTLNARWDFYNLSMMKDNTTGRYADDDGLPFEVGDIFFQEL